MKFLDKLKAKLGLDIEPQIPLDEMAEIIFQALGGASNIEDIGTCATRLRIVIRDPQHLDLAIIRQTKPFGIIRLADTQLQIIYGVKANLLSQYINEKCDTAKMP
ncbi:TPA: PTS transporter subunit EIIB [Photobacterium damselae]